VTITNAGIHIIDDVDPYKKPSELVEISPKGLVPALKLHNYNPPRSLHESMVILEYLQEYEVYPSGSISLLT
jgi:glutathione S-transferase